MEQTLSNRVVVLIDMDCFYCQVEEKLNPELQGKPIAVVQYNPWKGGGIIAVNYVARAMGVTRHMRGDEAKEKCPEIELPSVPCSRGKADISKYRDAGKEVAKVLQRFTTLLERASIDEAYLDITEPVLSRLESVNIETINPDIIPNTYALGYDCIQDFIKDIQNCGNGCVDFDYVNAKQMLIGAVIVSEIRHAVFLETGYRCSAGIAHNKILAKLVCGMNKPNKQTILSKNSINILYEALPLKKVKHLGGKFGNVVCEKLKIKNMGELQSFSEKDLQSHFDEKNGSWLYNIARGIDLEPVLARFNPKSIGCCKNFKGKAALLDFFSLKKWLKDLGDEIEDRLEKDAVENNRTPKQMVVSFSVQLADGSDTSSSRSYNLMPDDELVGDYFSSKALDLVLESAEGVKAKDGVGNRKLKAPIKFLGISVGKFEENSEGKKTKKIKDYFTSGSLNPNTSEAGLQKNQMPNKKSSNDKEFIIKKFFQGSVAKTTKSSNPQEKVDNKKDDKVQSNIIVNDGAIVELSLLKQESFFAKYLNKEILPVIPKVDPEVRPLTPVYNIVTHGDDSNDSEYSGSTIDKEINKSIALFEDDPGEADRVSSMRQLLTSSVDQKEFSSNEAQFNEENSEQDKTVVCQECKEIIPLSIFQTHSDFHMALKLRDEERKLVKLERLQRTNSTAQQNALESNKKMDSTKGETIPSIKNFLVKLDITIPHELCDECGKRVAIDKFPEHSDFHAAQKINQKLNNKSTINNFLRHSAKRKRDSTSPIKKPKLPCKSIDSFFR